MVKINKKSLEVNDLKTRMWGWDKWAISHITAGMIQPNTWIY